MNPITLRPGFSAFHWRAALKSRSLKITSQRAAISAVFEGVTSSMSVATPLGRTFCKEGFKSFDRIPRAHKFIQVKPLHLGEPGGYALHDRAPCGEDGKPE